jgi:protein phosphatase
MSNVARPGNEDAFLIATLQHSMLVHDSSLRGAGGSSRGLSGTLLTVTDGLGRESDGDVASRRAVNMVASYLLDVLPWTVVSRTLHEPRMGSALTMALVLGPMLYIAHVGDTRCYLLRSGELSRLTTDHAPARDRDAPEPRILQWKLEVNDRLLLCSAGLTRHLSDARISATLATGVNVAVCERLIALSSEAGGPDDVTVIVADAPRAADSSYSVPSSGAEESAGWPVNSTRPLHSA